MDLENFIPESLNSIINEELYVPHYQPIVNAINRKILGYEVLGRLYSITHDQFLSLGPYFHGKRFNLTQKVQVDRIIREKAIKYLKNSGNNTKLFFNFMPNILSSVHQDELLDPGRFHLIQLIEKYEIDRKNIVIEITEDEFDGKTERLLMMVNIFRNYGFKIAIDDMGAGFSNLERIGYIHPDIIKVDIRIMRESLNRTSFRHVLDAISEMSLKLGSELLFEGIETEKELTLALSMGANLLQGFYFSKAMSEFQNTSLFADDLSIILEKFGGIRFLELVEDYSTQQDLVDHLSSVLESIEILETETSQVHVSRVEKILPSLPSGILEVFLVDMHGYQLSPSYVHKEDNSWEEDFKHIGNNYAWKPYFMRHKAEAYYFKKKWGVTKPFYDMEHQLQYVIFTFNLNANLILIAKVKC
ncbi:MAG: EAL domain-containing protein [Leptospiraceae bacterium]|nr:EAL domain-containing protein [Leptospiraceae bacterium]MCP5499427.1 EAL domain-containing protein [Leptospiraceae bacterium]